MPIRVAIYARYSSENQREASIEDQIEVCRRYLERNGWVCVQTYSDAAVSGASRFRPGLAAMLTDAEAGKVDIVVCESIDRLGRNLSDVADLFDRLSFCRVQLHATSLGLVSQMHVGIMGTMAQMALSDLRDKTRRGQLGRARQGKIPGGLAYGYEVIPPPPGAKESGDRRIVEAEAAIVRRIFWEYVGGKSARCIARDLNLERVAGPGGRPWIDTTIRGQAERGTGLLNNTLYIGQLSWNRCSYVKDPRTGKRLARVNPSSEWEIVAVPELRIIDEALWNAAKARQAALSFETSKSGANPLNASHRPRFLLSGLLACGCCGAGYTIIGKDRYGCAARRGKGTCENSKTITRDRIEARVLDGLRDCMLTPELVEEFVRVFETELASMQREAVRAGEQLDRELEQVNRKLAGIVRAVEDGAWNPTLRARLTELETRKAQLEAEREVAGKPPALPRLHPNAAAIYREKVQDLQNSLSGAAILTEASTILRGLITTVVLTPDATAPDGVRAELHGDLAQILTLTLPALSRRGGGERGRGVAGTSVPGGQLSVVAGAGFEPATFRL